MPTLYGSDATASLNNGSDTRTVTFVIKVSKLCNLRCQYCYEFPELANREAISLTQLRSLYRHIADHYYDFMTPVNIEFVWHGGEPLLLGPDFYWTTFDDQTRAFPAAPVFVTNLVQTNLFSLNHDLLKLLYEGFDGVGVSIDLYGGLRRSVAGRDSQAKVIANMERLIEAGVAFGCITVLTKQNIGRAPQIFRFFEEASLSFRLLPVFRGATDPQNEPYALTSEEVLASFQQFFDLWVQSSRPMVIEPLYGYIENLIAGYASEGTGFYNKAAWESIYVVNTDGNLYSYADLYKPELAHGNLFLQPLSQLIRGPGHQRAIKEAEGRMGSVCTACEYFGRACSGYPVAEESPGYGHAAADGTADCVKDRGILKYIERRLYEIGIIDPISGTLKLPPNYEPRFMRVLASGP